MPCLVFGYILPKLAIVNYWESTAIARARRRRTTRMATKQGPIKAQFSALFGRHCAVIGSLVFFAVVSSRVSWTQSVFVWRLWRQQQTQKQPLDTRLLPSSRTRTWARPRWILVCPWLVKKKILDSMRYSRGVAYLQSATQIAIAPLPPCNLVAKLAPSCDRKKNYTKRNHFVVNVDKLTVLFTGSH